MPDLRPRNMAALRSGTISPSQLHDLIQDIVNAHNSVAQQTNAAPVGENPPPSAHSALSVKGGAGIFDVAITDNSPKYRDHHNFVEYTQNNDWSNAHVLALGASRNWRGSLGAGSYQFRSYAQYPTTAPSDMTYHGEVSGAGSVEPTMQASQGSGTSATPGAGFGGVPFTGDTRPIR